MLNLGTHRRIFVGIDPVDMRGSFFSLAGTARRLDLEPTDGNLYLFFNRTRTLCKLLWFDGSGWCLLSKRLERGTFELPAVKPHTLTVTVDAPALASILAGIELAAPRRRWDRRPTP